MITLPGNTYPDSDLTAACAGLILAPPRLRTSNCDRRKTVGDVAALFASCEREQRNSDSNTIGKHLQVFVRDNNVEQALRVLKKDMQREGVFREMKRRKAYEKPSERKTREKAEAIRRVRKAARKQAQRDVLIPMPKRREDVRRSVAGLISCWNRT